MSNNKKGSISLQDQAYQINDQNIINNEDTSDVTKIPLVDGQCAEVLAILRNRPTLSFEFTAERAIPQVAARVFNLKEKGYNVITEIKPEIVFRGRVRRHVALYYLGNPEWPRPGFLSDNDLPPAA